MFVAEILGAERMNRKRKLYLQNVSGDELVRAEKTRYSIRERRIFRVFLLRFWAKNLFGIFGAWAARDKFKLWSRQLTFNNYFNAIGIVLKIDILINNNVNFFRAKWKRSKIRWWRGWI